MGSRQHQATRTIPAFPGAENQFISAMQISISAVWVSSGDAAAEGLEAARFCFDPASDMVSGPSLPECSSVVPVGAQGVVSGACCRTVLLPWPPIHADGDDGGGLAVDDCRMATAGFMRPVGGHSADLFVFGDLVQQLRQHRAVVIAARGELHLPDVRSGCVHDQMHLAPLSSALNTVLAGQPFNIPEELYAGAVHLHVLGAIGAPIRDLDGQRLLPPAQGGVVGHSSV